MTQNKTEEEVVNEVMEELVDFDGGNTTGGTVETNNISTNTENKSSGAESSKEETQLNNVAEAPKEVKLDNENTAEDVQSAEDKKETNGEGKSEEGDKEDHDSTSPPAEGEYEVETIVKHRKKKGKPNTFQYLIRWKGYGEDEMTWENADDLFCDDLVAEYWEKVKNQEVQANEGKKVSRSASKGKAKNTPPPIVKSENKRGRPKEKTDDNDRPRKQRKKKGDDDNDNWESQVVAVETVTRDDKTGELMVFLRWANGDTSKHPSKEANVKCPQQMIRFYEQRLTFAPPSTNKT